jgi:AraC-like DNA-binding protein
MDLMSPRTTPTRFFEQAIEVRQLLRTFDHLPGVHYFVKDAESRTMGVSPGSIIRMGGRTEADVIGMKPHDYLPSDLAEKYLADDRRVIRTGRPLVNLLELGYFEPHLREWIITDKHPLRNRRGKVIGLIGTLRSYTAGQRHLAQAGPATDAATYIRKHLGEELRLDEIADAVGYSGRQLERLFQRVFQMTVRQFIIETRIHAATRELTQTDRSITDIAMEFGFCDPSAFSHTFKTITGLSPRAYRQQHRRSN